MSTISDLQLKIGADSSGLQKELNKVPGTVKTAFKVNPVRDMQSARRTSHEVRGSKVHVMNIRD